MNQVATIEPRALQRIDSGPTPADLLRLAASIESKSMPVTESGCLLWTGHTDPGGYGTLQFKRKGWKAHRASWTVAHGEIPNGLKILHKCDTPACIRVDHLFIGTQAENISDMISKGRFRSSHVGIFGARHPRSKMTQVQADRARSMYSFGASQHAIAKLIGVSVMTINRLVRNISWRAA